VRCKIASHLYQVVPETTLPVTLAVCGCHLWHNSNDHCHCYCIQLDNGLRSFRFPFFSSKISWPHFAISACFRGVSLRNSGMPPYSAVDQKSRTNNSDSIHGSSRGVSSTTRLNSRCFVLRACIPLFSSVFLASAHHPSHMAHATIGVWNLGPEGLFWINLCWLFPLAFHESISCIPGIVLVFSLFSRSMNCVSPFVKTKVTSHCLHATVMSCSGPSATASVYCCDTTSSINTSSLHIWILSRRQKICPFGSVRFGVFSLLMNSVLLPECMINISLLIADNFVSLMVHVQSVILIWFPELNGHAAYLLPRHSFCNACDSTPSAAHCVACRAPLVLLPYIRQWWRVS